MSHCTRRTFLARATAAAAAACAARPIRAAGPSLPLQTQILNAKVRFVNQAFLRPLIISSGAITEITEAVAEVTVRVDGHEATGRGSIYLSDLWAWPDPAISHADRDARLRALCQEIAGNLYALCGGEPAHPLELGLRLHTAMCHEPVPPVLARSMAASPFDAAIHDAVGLALGRSAFRFYDEPVALPSADPFFKQGKACEAIRATLRPEPKRELMAWYLVGKNDSIEKDVGPWVRDRGYRCFKIKIFGKDNAYDVGRTVEVYRGVKALGARDPWITVDTNEANPDAASVLDYYQRLKAADAEAFAALKYFEQPTGRDILVHQFDWHPVAAVKPVLLDEGLTSLELMAEAARQGWNGFALKTCKGHSFALTAAAWARQNGMPVALQDLTNPGISLIHAAWFAAFVPTINDVELNSLQFTPAANQAWLPRLAGLFDARGGVHRLPDRIPPGLGSTM